MNTLTGSAEPADTPDHDPVAEYRTRYRSLMSSAARAMRASVTLTRRK